MSNCFGMNPNAWPHGKAVPCPTPSPIVTPVPGQELEAFAVQDGSIPQVITLLTALPILTGVGRTAIAFNRFVQNTLGAVPAIPDPPGFTGSLVVPPGGFTGVAVTQTGVYDLTAGLSLVGVDVGIIGTLTAQIVVFPGGVGTNAPQVIAEIPLAETLNIAALIALPLLRGTVFVPNVPLNAGDVVQIQLVQNAALLAATVVAVTYAFLEIE